MFFDVEFQDKNIVFLLTRSSYSEFTQLTFSLHILPELQYYFRLKAVTFDHTTVHIYLERGLEPKKWWRKWKNCWTSVPSLSKVLTSLLPWQSNVYNLLWLSRGRGVRVHLKRFPLFPKKISLCSLVSHMFPWSPWLFRLVPIAKYVLFPKTSGRPSLYKL